MALVSSYRLHRYIITSYASLWLIFVIFLSRLVFLQLYKSRELGYRAEKNYTRFSIITPIRGNIIDAQGNLLATNRPVIDIYWKGTGNKKLSIEQVKLINFLEQTCHLNGLIPHLSRIEKLRQKQLLASDISLDVLSMITEKFSLSDNIIIEKNFKRLYPHKRIASHVIGYINHLQYEHTGKMGLEKILQDSLKGQHGQMMRIIDSVGSDLAQQEVKAALDGSDIHTTIDLKLQIIAEKSFDLMHAGAFIVLDPEDGAIKALVSRPNFDPNIFLQHLTQQEWQILQEQKPFLNRAFNACYPPASIFKLVSLSAALEKEIIHLDDKVICRGYTLFGGTKYHCKRRIGHGELSVQESVATSCNILFYHIGKRISINDLADFAHKFGLGKKTNIIFQEQEGLIPSTRWKHTVKKEAWWAGETLHASIGQGYLLTTPIQIARMIGSIFTGNLATPHLLKEEEIVLEPLEILPQTRKFLKKSMRLVVTRGTGKYLNRLKNMKIYAKTGTAQIDDNNQEHKQEHAWFVACVKPSYGKPMILVVLIEHAGSSSLATSVALKFLLSYNARYNKSPEALSK